MSASPGEVCGICAAPLRAGASFCGRCGAEQGLMIPRDLGVGDERAGPRRASSPDVRGRGLAVALTFYSSW